MFFGKEVRYPVFGRAEAGVIAIFYPSLLMEQDRECVRLPCFGLGAVRFLGPCL